MNTLYYGDNLNVLREQLKDESVDLIYLDPPFNSNANYNVLFKSPTGEDSHAQIEAFTDTWHWGEQSEREFTELLSQPNTDVANLITALRGFLGANDMMAYLTAMAIRLLELHRVLKPTGSLYLHCDPTASHYLKIVLDALFGKENYRNEIIWQRTAAKGDAKQKFGSVHDSILFYVKSNANLFKPVYLQADEEYLSRFKLNDDDGRGPYRLAPLDSPNYRPNLTYVYKGYQPPEKGWRVSEEVMKNLDEEGRLHFPKNPNGRISRKHYLNEQAGRKVSDVWVDISPLQAAADERLGYPTQKPLALLERIIQASSNAGDVILDPFCGCGTAIHAAQSLNRNWIGIDITHLAISLIENRLKTAFPEIQFDVQGTPKDLDGARDLAERDKYQFQWWACSLVNAQPYQGKKKGADGGIDGQIFFQDEKHKPKKIVVSVKGGNTVSVAMIRDLAHVVEREQAAIGLFITLAEPTKPMRKEATGCGFYQSHAYGNKLYPKIQILTIADLLTGQARPEYPVGLELAPKSAPNDATRQRKKQESLGL